MLQHLHIHIFIILTTIMAISACGRLKELAKASEIPSIPAHNVTEFIRYLTCTQTDDVISLTQCLAQCMSLDFCDAVRYATECNICGVTSARNEGDIDLGLWFVDLDTSNCKYE